MSELESLRSELASARAALALVSGALCDSGLPVPEEAKYGEAVRELVAEVERSNDEETRMHTECAKAHARAEKAERERDKWREMYNTQCLVTSRETETSIARLDSATAAESALATATARIAELEGLLRDLAAAIGRCGCDNDEHAHYCHEARERIFSLAALAPNAPPKVEGLPLPYIGTPGRQGCHPEGCPMPGLHTITSCNWFRQQLHRFGRHVPGCTLNGEDCSCGLLQMLAGRPLAATRFVHPAPHAEGEPATPCAMQFCSAGVAMAGDYCERHRAAPAQRTPTPEEK